MNEETIYDVYWEGPFYWGDKKLNNPDYVLYSFHGTHPLYGNNKLLYIGMTEVSPGERFISHNSWVRYEYDAMTIKVASVDIFKGWKEWENYEYDRYKKFVDTIVLRKIEALLIIAHQPAYNSVNKETANNAKGIRVFNTGNIGLLFPEVSYLYHVGKK